MDFRLIPYRFFGANYKEFYASVLIAIVGFAMVSSVSLEPAFSYRESYSYHRLISTAADYAGQLVVGCISLLCAINAARDEDNPEKHLTSVRLWCYALFVWVLVSLSQFIISMQRINN